MKNKIKLTVAAIAAVMMIAAGINAYANNLSGSKYADDIRLISAIGIMNGYEDGNFYPEKNISRQEFAALTVRMMKMEGCADADKLPFTDADTWARSYISDAYALGLIEGYDNTTFGSNDPLTVNQAVKIIVGALGYREYAEKNGGYPYGYNAFAAKNGILDRVAVGEKNVTRGEVAALIANSLDVLMSETVFSSDGNIEYTQGNMTLAQYLGLNKIKGVLAAAGTVNLTDTEISENEIIIGDTVYKAQLSGLEQYIGNTVSAYASDDEPYTVYYVFMLQGDKSLTVSSDDIDPATTKNSFAYKDEKNKTRKIEISPDSIIVYNGKLLPTAYITDDLFKPESGNVTFTGFTNSTSYDVIKITEFETYIAASVFNDSVYDLFGRKISAADFEDSEKRLTITKGDENISIADIKTNDVLSVAVSLDGDYMAVYVCDDIISGEVSGKSLSDGRTSVWIDNGEELKTSVWYDGKIAEGDGRMKAANPGDVITAMLDVNGDIAFIGDSDAANEMCYGVLVDIEGNNGIAAGGKVKILTTDNEFVIYEIAGKIKFGRMKEGSYTVSNADAGDICRVINNNTDSAKVQLVKYSAQDKALKKLYLADTTGTSGCLESCGAQFNGHYRAGVIDGRYIVDKNTVLFAVPGDGSETEKLYSAFASDVLKNGSNNNIKIYDVKNGIIGAMVKLDTILTGSLYTAIDMVNSDIMIVESAKYITNDAGDTYLAATGFVNGSRKTVLYSDTLSKMASGENAVKAGCLVQYETNGRMLNFAYYKDYDEVVEAYKVLHNLNDAFAESYQSWNYTDIRSDNAQICISYGTLSYKDDKNFTAELAINGEPVRCAFSVNSGTEIYKYSRSEKKTEKCTYDDVSVGMTVLVRQRYGAVREIIIAGE